MDAAKAQLQRFQSLFAQLSQEDKDVDPELQELAANLVSLLSSNGHGYVSPPPGKAAVSSTGQASFSDEAETVEDGPDGVL